MQRSSRSLWAVVVKGGVCLFVCALLAQSAGASGKDSGCHQAVLEANVLAGQGFEKVFTSGLRFYLEPLRSGWIVRVLDANAPRSAHDFAELATPPYQSVSPLLISTDWAFRAQDAAGWNPRHFRFAQDGKAFAILERLLPQAVGGSTSAEERLAALVSVQPEATFEALNVRFAPGVADQARMASAVALNLAITPHEVDTTSSPSPLGKLEALHFRVTLQLPRGIRAAGGVEEHTAPCAQPTAIETAASHPEQRKKR